MIHSNEVVTDTELEILKALWESSPQTARELTEKIYGEVSPSRLGSIQKLLQRLERKDCVVRDRSQHVHRFTSSVDANEIAGRYLNVLAGKVSGGSFLPFISHLIGSKKISKKEREAIMRLLDSSK